MSHKGVNRVLCAALVDNNFRLALLDEPAEACQSGFHGNYFDLAEAELQMLSSVKTNKLEDFAMHVHAWLGVQEKQTENVPEFCKTANYLPGYSLIPDRYVSLPSPGHSK